ncbi:MAG: hypothetical protein EPO42_03680 [Gallionellaceae bacterium]|nr:MAG: hypothetical protein EPO42_03680 [Gallionellaceae bacterium]
MKRTSRNHAQGFKVKVALVEIKGGKTLTGLAGHFGVYPNQVSDQKQLLQGSATGVFGAPKL